MEKLKILQKTYDMIKYGNQCLLQFPRAERYALAAEIKQSMYKILRLIIQANKQRSKRKLQIEIDIELDVLRTFIRLAADKQIKYLSLRKYEIWSKQLNEIGRMLGGWMKATKYSCSVQISRAYFFGKRWGCGCMRTARGHERVDQRS